MPDLVKRIRDRIANEPECSKMFNDVWQLLDEAARELERQHQQILRLTVQRTG